MLFYIRFKFFIFINKHCLWSPRGFYFKDTLTPGRKNTDKEENVRQRNHRIQVRLNDKEYAAFRKRLAKTGLSAEGYLRTLIAGFVPKELPSKEFREAVKELYGIESALTEMRNTEIADIIKRLRRSIVSLEILAYGKERA